MVLNNLPCLKRVCWKVARCARLVINEASGGLWRRDFEFLRVRLGTSFEGRRG